MASALSIVRASAGSGKTFTLAAEYCRAVVLDPSAYRSILAVTFTNKATGEMKHRIIEELHGLSGGASSQFLDIIASSTSLPRALIAERAGEALELILRDFSSFSVMTIDKFFQRIIRSFFRELGLDFSFKVQIDNEKSMVIAIDRLLEESGQDPVLAQLIERVVGERLDAGGSWNVVPELRKISSEIFREEYREPNIATADLIAFFGDLKKEYDKVNEELRHQATLACDLIRGAGLTPLDFKYGRTSFAHYLFKIERGDKLEKYGKRFEELVKEPEGAYTDKSPSRDAIVSILGPLVERVAQIIRLYDDSSIARATFDAIATNFSKYLLIGHLKRSFSSVMADSGELAISHTTQFIDDIARTASMPFIFEKLGNRYTTIFIDEFQDTSRGQWRGFLPLLHEAIAKADEQRVMLIGDVKQAIYRWRGGDWNILAYKAELEFEDKVDNSLSLTTSYRSEKQIVEFNNSLIKWVVAGAQNVVADMLDGIRTEGYDELITALARAYLGANQKVAPDKIEQNRGYVSVGSYETEEDSLNQMLESIKGALGRGYSPSDLAVLVRRRVEGVEVAKFLVDNGYSIVSDEVLLLKNSPTVNFILDVFRFALSSTSVRRAAINRYLGRKFEAEFSPEEVDFFTNITNKQPISALELIIQFFALQDREVGYLQGLYDVIYTYTKDVNSDMQLFLNYWEENSDKLSLSLSENINSINILTIHKAKGLEYGCVFIPFASWSFTPSAMPPTRLWVETDRVPYDKFNPLPVNYSQSLSDSIYRDDYLREGVYSMVDNINLLYVALTRAREELYVNISAKPGKSSIAMLIEQGLAAMEWQGSTGSLSTHIPNKKRSQAHTIILDRMESYPERSRLAVEEIQSQEDLFGD